MRHTRPTPVTESEHRLATTGTPFASYQTEWEANMPQPENEPLGADEPRRAAVWRLFRNGELDEDAATAHLLAIDLELRRAAPARHLLPERVSRPSGRANGHVSFDGQSYRRRADAA